MNISAETVLEYMIAAERAAAEIMLSARGVATENKTSSRDIITEFDRRVQQLLVERLSAAMPDAAFFCEESQHRDSTGAEHVFIIDPIDGTMNFSRHMNSSCISIAYMSRGTLTAAAVYNPYVDELYTAVKGKGARLNGSPIHVDDAPLKETLFCLGSSPYDHKLTDETFRLARLAFDESLDLRRFASAELDFCYVAAGRAGLYFELSTFLWDFAAGSLIVEEAGGICSDINGDPLPLDGRKSSVLAGGRQAYADFLKIIRNKEEQ